MAGRTASRSCGSPFCLCRARIGRVRVASPLFGSHRLSMFIGTIPAVALAMIASLAAPPREITIRGLDYAFVVPGAIAPGRALLRFDNRGKVFHELNIQLLRPGVSAREFMDSVRAGKP